MPTTIPRIKILLLAALAILSALILWQFRRGPISPANKTTGSQAAKSVGKLDWDVRPLAEKPIVDETRVIRVNSISEAEEQARYSVRVPQRLFGQNARIFVGKMASSPDGRRGVTVSYSDETTPTYYRGFIQIGPRDPGLASYAVLVEEWQKEGSPYTLKEHKGHPGYTLEKGFNEYLNGRKDARPAGVVWLDGDIEFQFGGRWAWDSTN